MSNKFKISILCFTLLILVGLTAFFVSSNKVPKSLWSAETVQPFKEWFQINWHGQAVGWASIELHKKEGYIIVSEEDYIEGRVQGERLIFRYQRKLFFSKRAPYALVSGSVFSQEPNLEINAHFVNNASFKVTQQRNNKTISQELPAIAFNLTDYLALRSFIESQPEINQSFVGRELDMATYQVQSIDYLVKETPIDYKKNFVVMAQDSSTKDIRWLKIKPNGAIAQTARASGMQFVSSTGKVTLNPEMQEDLYLNSGVKVDRELGVPRKIDKLVLSLQQGDIGWFKKHPDVVVDELNRLHLDPGSRYQATSTFAINKRQLNTLASELAKAETRSYQTDWQKVNHLVSYVNDYIEYKASPSGFNIDEILQQKVGDCTEYAKLLVEMLNAIDIPAREISGLVYLGDHEKRFGGHVWVEVLLDGYWLSVDPTWNLMEVTSTHIPLSIGEKGAMDALSSPIKLAFSLEEISYK